MNLYATRQDFISWIDTKMASDVVDDAVIDDILEDVSRTIDSITGRTFFPRIETRLFSIPKAISRDTATLMLDEDLLEVKKLTNGDSTEITTSDYYLESANYTPYWAVKLSDVATVTWQPNSSGSQVNVISLDGVWGYHDRYAYAWKAVTTLGAAISDTTSLTFTVASNTAFGRGSIIRIGDEVCNVVSTGTGTITVNVRGDNGSTAATHLNGATVLLWQVMPQLQAACLIIAKNQYMKRFAQNDTDQTIITPTGTILPPSDIPSAAMTRLRSLVRIA